jgi:hypothetical protein
MYLYYMYHTAAQGKMDDGKGVLVLVVRSYRMNDALYQVLRVLQYNCTTSTVEFDYLGSARYTTSTRYNCNGVKNVR